MPIPYSVPVGEAVPEPGVRPVRGPPAGRAGAQAEVTLRLVEDRDRIATGMNDIVVSRLFAAGLSLETALPLMGDHPAAGRIQEAIGELDLAIRDFRDVLFDHHRTSPHPDGPPG
jgi:hypothetical protein